MIISLLIIKLFYNVINIKMLLILILLILLIILIIIIFILIIILISISWYIIVILSFSFWITQNFISLVNLSLFIRVNFFIFIRMIFKWKFTPCLFNLFLSSISWYIKYFVRVKVYLLSNKYYYNKKKTC